ncbi:MAG: hypothetical protein IEMM0008_1770 [bacterium]|nr:MAG: hypothetical protein IEMM0008_1770 [bacterium]
MITLKVEVLWAFGVLVSLAVSWFFSDYDTSTLSDNTFPYISHFHLTLIPITIFGGFAAIYHWFPKIIGRQYNKVLAYIHFVLTVLFFYGTFLPMLLPSSMGHKQRIIEGYTDKTYPKSLELIFNPESINIFILVMTIGLALTQLVWVYNMIWSGWKGKPVDTKDIKPGY